MTLARSGASLRILIADDDATFRRLAAETLRLRAPHHQVTVVDDGARALDSFNADRGFDVLVLDWLMPKLTGTQVCKAIRGDGLLPQPYILFATSRCRREEVFECLAAGADDLLTKPVPPDVLVERIELANHRRAAAAANSGPAPAAIVAARTEGQGELVFRSGEITARIYFKDGKVAWAHVADGSEGLLQALEPELGGDRETVRAAVEESRKTGDTLTETLVAWGLVSRARLRESVGVWIRKKIEIILRLPSPQTLFLPHRRGHSEELLFELDEVMDPQVVPSGIGLGKRPTALDEVRPSLIPARGWAAAFLEPPTRDARCSTILDACMNCDGFLGAAVVDRLMGYCLERRGCELNPDTVWAHLQCLGVIAREEVEVEDTIVCAHKRYHLARTVPHSPNTVVYVVVDASTVSLATARFSLKRAIEGAIGDAAAAKAV